MRGLHRIKRKQLLVTCGVIASLLLSASVFILYRHHVHAQEIESMKRTFARIEPGMNKDHVQDLLGRKPDYQGSYPDHDNRMDCSWTMYGYRMDIICTRDGTITRKELNELYSPGVCDYFRRLFLRDPF